ncbi:alanine--tRNA ligase [cyanobiont of Ornithocercus magnificus]|nr:alanine--tRNA ligase [cyanobiont of Ornithocercus magnificus]
MVVSTLSNSGASRPLSGAEIRRAFLQFYEERGHQVVPSASLIPKDPTVLLTIAGMLPFKPVFLGQQRRPAPRAVTSQRCIRTNDIENVGRTARHHTFFEMLGNFSFGDYFKEQAIQWAWELSTDVFGLDPKSLVVSIFQEDDEAEYIWRRVVGISPKRIIRMGKKDNFWSSGPTGPCGPCSEIYYDFKSELGEDNIDLEDDGRFIEFYNLVFMQYERDAKGELRPLINRSIDTGMGLERMAQILQGVPNNYETDLIYPLIERAALLARVDYQRLDEKSKTSLKVISDHSRAIIQLISDGVTASNLGRGYVLRRLLRRTVRHGRTLGIGKPFLKEMGEAAINLLKSTDPNVLEHRNLILAELECEEKRFLETLERGEKLLAEILALQPKYISGSQVFELYDTYGFPPELTQEIAEEQGLTIDLEGFRQAMEEQRRRAKAATTSLDLTLQGAVDRIIANASATSFHGYETLNHSSGVQALLVNGKTAAYATAGDTVQVVLDSTAFYGGGGGQVSDRGVLILDQPTRDKLIVRIEAVDKVNDVFVHSGRVECGTLAIGEVVHGRVDRIHRHRAQVHHTATHLLQAALRLVVDQSVRQAGSLVDFERLRFDFHSAHVTTLAELERIEDLVNSWIAEARALKTREMELESAKAVGAIAMFGEKYADVVRVVDVPGISLELCGGTHVANTAELGLFKIIAESSVAAGVRRIEAVAGSAVLAQLNKYDAVVRQLSNCFKVQPTKIVDRVVALQKELKLTGKTLVAVRSDLAVAKSATLIKQAKNIGGSQLLVSRLDGIDSISLQGAAQNLAAQLGDGSAVVLGGLPDTVTKNSKVILVVVFGKDVVRAGLKAGKFIAEIARRCGGGGGGRDEFAQAGGNDATALDAALREAEDQLTKNLSLS